MKNLNLDGRRSNSRNWKMGWKILECLLIKLTTVVIKHRTKINSGFALKSFLNRFEIKWNEISIIKEILVNLGEWHTRNWEVALILLVKAHF